MSQLICDTQQWILNDLDKAQAVDEQLNKKRITTNKIESVTTNKDNLKQNQLVDAIINGVKMHTNKNSSTHIWYPTNWIQYTAAANFNNNNNSGGNNYTIIIPYNRLGNPFWLESSAIKNLVRKALAAWKNSGHIL